MTRAINLNADMGEGFGRYELGHDLALMTVVTSVNLACGYHAGDPSIMHRLVVAAKAHGVSVGAHPGFADVQGFGRRAIQMDPAALEHMIAYQIGALQGMARYAGLAVTHVKAHGALYNMAARDDAYAMAIGRAIRTLDPAMIFVVPPLSAMERAARALGLRLAREGFPDRAYRDDGQLVDRSTEGAVISDPDVAARRAVGMARDGTVTTAGGQTLPLAVDTLCIHGDTPHALEIARAVRAALEDAGHPLVPLTALQAC